MDIIKQMPPPPSCRLNSVNNQEIHSLYVLRALCALLVVIIHTPHEWIGEALRPFLLIAVPVFFLLSGYFLYHADESRMAQRAASSAKKLFLISVGLNLLYWFIRFLLDNEPYFAGAIDIFWTIALGRSIQSVMWFLTDLATSMLLIFLLCKFRLVRYLWLSLFIIPLQLLLTTYSSIGLLNEPSERLLLFYHILPNALPYFWLAFFIRKHIHRLREAKWLEPIVVFLAILAYGEWYYSTTNELGKITLENILTAPLAVGLVVLALKYPSFGKGSLVADIGKYHSANIYYYHMIFVMLLHPLLDEIDYSFGYYKLGFVYVFPLTIALSILIQTLSRQAKRLINHISINS